MLDERDQTTRRQLEPQRRFRPPPISLRQTSKRTGLATEHENESSPAPTRIELETPDCRTQIRTTEPPGQSVPFVALDIAAQRKLPPRATGQRAQHQNCTASPKRTYPAHRKSPGHPARMGSSTATNCTNSSRWFQLARQ